MRVLIACEYSGRVRDAFLALGHDAMSCDLLPTDVEGPHHMGDVTELLHMGWDLMIAHPPLGERDMTPECATGKKSRRSKGAQTRSVWIGLPIRTITSGT